MPDTTLAMPKRLPAWKGVLSITEKAQARRLPKAVADAGIDFEVAHVWLEGDRNFERSLKRRHGAGKFCPVCRKLKSC